MARGHYNYNALIVFCSIFILKLNIFQNEIYNRSCNAIPLSLDHYGVH